MSKKAKKPAPVKTPWRQRITLSAMLLWTVLGAILIAGSGAGYYALQVLYDNKLRDTWAILFLELEQQSNRLGQAMELLATQWDPKSTTASAPALSGIIWLDPAGGLKVVRGDFPTPLPLSELGLKQPSLPARYSVLQVAGKNYLALPTDRNSFSLDSKAPAGNYWALYTVDISQLYRGDYDSKKENSVYLLTKQGKLLVTNNSQITGVNFVDRPLVQRFIANPLRQGQMEFESSEGSAYGFFHEVPNTNVMIFVETSQEVALVAVRDIALRYCVVLLAIIALTGIILQFPITSLVIAPMRELVRVADEVGAGNFDVYPRRRGLGELAVLTSSIKTMAENLITRDVRIKALLIEQKEKTRLADELAIAHSIQNNFLLNTPLPRESGIEVAAQYTPAAEVAGDWYGYCFDPGTGESVFAIADVSGHGAGSAMFTAIIAAAFDENREIASQAGELFPLDLFASKLNRLILRLGHGKMHATLLIVSLVRGSGELRMLNAGHPAPLLVPSPESGEANEPLVEKTDLLGVNADFTPLVTLVPFVKGTSLFMFTDGLIEGSPDHKLYSERRLSKAATLSGGQPINQMVIRVYEDWKNHLKGQQALDDVCLLALRAAA